MLLKQKSSGHFVDIVDTAQLTNPCKISVAGQMSWGEELGEREMYAKDDLCFPSGEQLPICWKDAHYREMTLNNASQSAGNGKNFTYYGA